MTIEIETLNREKKQAETAVKGLQTMCRNLAIQKTQLTTERTELQSQLSEGKITLDEYNRKKADLEKQISNCDVKLADKQQKLEQKMKELQDIKDKVNFYDVAYVRFDVPEIKVRPPMYAAKNSILGERKFRLMNQRDMEKLSEDYHTEKYLRHQQIHETLDLLAFFEKPDTAKVVREVAIALIGGRYVNLPCAGGGSVSSETGWDGRKKDEENEDFRLRCWLHAAKTVKASRYVPTKRKGYGR